MSPRVCTILTLAALFTGCATPPVQPAPTTARPARINHVVFFKLNDPADADEFIADCDTELATIPGVVSYYAGRHIELERANVDSNYDVGLYLGFMSVEDYDRYLSHGNHQSIVRNWGSRLEWIRIHDVLDETP